MSYPTVGLPSAIWSCRFPYCGGMLVHRVCRWLCACGLDRFFFSKTDFPLLDLGLKEDDLTRCTTDVLSGHHVSIAFTWPSVSRSSGRCYGFAYDCETMRLLCFLKVAFSKSDRDELQREIKALEWIQSRGSLAVKVPRALFAKEVSASFAFGAFELLPENIKPVCFDRQTWKKQLARIKDSFAGGTCRSVSRSDVERAGWLARFKEVASSIQTYFEEACQNGLEVCATHGDMAPHNFCRDDEGLWLFDWENFTTEGPALVDELVVYVCVRRFSEKLSYEKMVEEFLRDYPLTDDRIACKVIQAAAFIVGYRLSYHDDFARIIEVYGRARREAHER